MKKVVETLTTISQFIGRYMAWIILGVAALAFFAPGSCAWIQSSWISYLLMVIMFGMGVTLKFEDFRVLLTRPKDVLIGTLTQFTVMPLIAFCLGHVFGLETGLFAGLILVATCPGGTASNVMTFLSGGDTALSVGMTSINTLLAPILTPAITYLLLHTTVNVAPKAMFISIIQVVIIPIVLGLVVNKMLGERVEQFKQIMPMISIVAISMIVAAVVSGSQALILATGPIVFVVVILQNLLGYAGGYTVARIFGLSLPKKKAMAIEIGMQNSGLACSLAATTFPGIAMATVPGAIYSVCHNITGAILANIFRKIEE